jgi:hypothetical protein
MNTCSIKKSFFLICFVLSGLFFASLLAQAQTSTFNFPALSNLATNPNFDFLISWRAINYVPSDYQGKILPSNGSAIEISFDVLDKGKFVNISNQNIEWSLNNNLIKSGIGLKTIRFVATNNNDQRINISIPQYKDSKYQAADLGAVITIPLSSPKIVINAPYPNKIMGLGENLFQALPYFFNISNLGQLQFSWNVNGAESSNQTTNSDILRLTASSQGQAAIGTNTSITVSAKNSVNQMEFAQSYINLGIK